jgi:hypothetical protein
VVWLTGSPAVDQCHCQVLFLSLGSTPRTRLEARSAGIADTDEGSKPSRQSCKMIVETLRSARGITRGRLERLITNFK